MITATRPTRRRPAAVLLLLTADPVLRAAALTSWASITDEVAAGRVHRDGGRTGHPVRVHLDDAWQDVTTVGPTSTTWQGTTDTFHVSNYSMTMTVWTRTQYGWTAESARTARIRC